jgi:NAD(P)-dependent dehydrogenase (short-subunit alcohol dehydrogenase family)
MDIAGKIAVVTGGASGIGLGIIRALADAGVGAVVIADVDAEKAAQTARSFSESGLRAFSHGCDVSSEDALERLADFAWSQAGPVDILFNNAGVTAPGNPLAATEADTRWEFDVNMFGVIHGTRVFARRFIADGKRGWICSTASHNGLGAPYPDVAGYVATKHGVIGYAAALRQQFGDKLGFSVLCPGPVNTGVWDAGRARPDRFGGPYSGATANRDYLTTHGMSPDEVGRMTVAGVAAEEFYIFTHPEDIALVHDRYTEARAAVARQFPAYGLPA